MAKLRILIAEILLRAALTIAPKNEDGALLTKHVAAYIKEVSL